MVFEGSAKHDGSNLSLNDFLEKGPNLVPDLFNIIIKFRGYPEGMVADVKKYQFYQLEFRLTPSPAILTSIIQHHLDLYKVKESEIVSLLQDSFYVDDFMGGALNDDQALEIHEKANDILKDGGFVLQK